MTRQFRRYFVNDSKALIPSGESNLVATSKNSQSPRSEQTTRSTRAVYHLTDSEIESLRANSMAFGAWAKEQLRIDRQLRHLRAQTSESSERIETNAERNENARQRD